MNRSFHYLSLICRCCSFIVYSVWKLLKMSHLLQFFVLLKWTCLVSLFDCKLQVFKIRHNGPWHFYWSFVYSNCRRSSLCSQCWLWLLRRFSNTVIVIRFSRVWIVVFLVWFGNWKVLNKIDTFQALKTLLCSTKTILMLIRNIPMSNILVILIWSCFLLLITYTFSRVNSIILETTSACCHVEQCSTKAIFKILLIKKALLSLAWEVI